MLFECQQGGDLMDAIWQLIAGLQSSSRLSATLGKAEGTVTHNIVFPYCH